MLQRICKSAITASFLVLAFSAILFSFTNKMGGDSFEVYINKKLVFQQYVTRDEAVKSLQLDQNNYNSQVEVYYNHCGQTGTGRTISIRDGQNKLLKEWHFQDSPGAKTFMTCNIKDIVGLQKISSGNKLNLYYASHELPAGRLLAAIIVDHAVQTAP